MLTLSLDYLFVSCDLNWAAIIQENTQIAYK